MNQALVLAGRLARFEVVAIVEIGKVGLVKEVVSGIHQQRRVAYTALLKESAHPHGLALLAVIGRAGIDALQHLQSDPGNHEDESNQDEKQWRHRSAHRAGQRKPSGEEHGKQKRARNPEVVCLRRKNCKRKDQQNEDQEGTLQ